MYSKRKYVRRRLLAVTRDDLLELARKIHAEFPTEELALLVGSPGYRGVDGELKNLIFAANGPKPKIVLELMATRGYTGEQALRRLAGPSATQRQRDAAARRAGYVPGEVLWPSD